MAHFIALWLIAAVFRILFIPCDAKIPAKSIDIAFQMRYAMQQYFHDNRYE